MRDRHGRKYGDIAGFASGGGQAGACHLDGGQLPSDAGILLPPAIEQHLRSSTAWQLGSHDRRDPGWVLHGLAEMTRYRALSRRRRVGKDVMLHYAP